MKNLNVKDLGLGEDATKAVEAIVEALNEKANANEVISKTEVSEMVSEGLKGLVSEEKMTGLKGQVEELAVSLKALKEEASAPKAPVSFKQAVVNALEKHKEDLARIQGAKSESSAGHVVRFAVKVADTMTIGNNITGEANVLPPQELLPGAISTTIGIPFIEEFIDMAGTTSALITWVEEKNDDGDAAFTGEGLAKAQIDFDLETYASSAKKVTDYIKVSEEMLNDIPFMASQIENKLRRRHDLKREDGILNGTASTTTFDGISTLAAAFIPGGFALNVVEANRNDVIVAALTQIVTASLDEYVPNIVFVNPQDFGLMKVEKASDGHYVLPPFTSADGTIVEGVRVVPKSKIPVDFFLIGDMSKAHVRELEAFNIEIGWENDDFTKNLRTIIGESRLHFFIAEEERKAFVYDQFSVAIAAINKV